VPRIQGTNPKIHQETGLGYRSFATSNTRFASGNIADKRASKLPGPGNYLGNSAVAKSPLTHLSGVDSQMNVLDQQRNNRSHNLKYKSVLNAHMGLTQAA
jgi:hypothetical protein